MNYRLICSSAVLCSFLASGCSTHTMNQTRNISTTAETYTNQLNNLLDVTKTQVIAQDSRQLAESRSSTDRAKNEKMLNQKNEALDNWIAEVDKLRKQNILLQNYFKALQAMVTNPERNEMSETLGTISTTINSINQAEAERRGDFSVFRGPNSGYISSLSQTLISRHYAAKVRKVLIRDRDIINRQIALHEVQLKMISKKYKQGIKFESAQHYKENVRVPYVQATSNFSSGSWVMSRIDWYEKRKALAIFGELKKANKAFREAWIDILQGKTDVGAVKAILSDVNRFAGDAYQLHNTYHNPPRYNLQVVTPPVQ